MVVYRLPTTISSAGRIGTELDFTASPRVVASRATCALMSDLLRAFVMYLAGFTCTTRGFQELDRTWIGCPPSGRYDRLLDRLSYSLPALLETTGAQVLLIGSQTSMVELQA